MLTASTPASASQLTSASAVARAQLDGGTRRAPNRSAQARRASLGSVAGHLSSLAPRLSACVRYRSRAARSRGRRAATTIVAITMTAKATKGSVIARATAWPDASPPATSRSAQVTEESTPPASRDQPASRTPAPSRVKRRKR
jgi:hypothetical protein